MTFKHPYFISLVKTRSNGILPGADLQCKAVKRERHTILTKAYLFLN